jgi:hypothetical protein
VIIHIIYMDNSSGIPELQVGNYARKFDHVADPEGEN